MAMRFKRLFFYHKRERLSRLPHPSRLVFRHHDVIRLHMWRRFSLSLSRQLARLLSFTWHNFNDNVLRNCTISSNQRNERRRWIKLFGIGSQSDQMTVLRTGSVSRSVSWFQLKGEGGHHQRALYHGAGPSTLVLPIFYFLFYFVLGWVFGVLDVRRIPIRSVAWRCCQKDHTTWGDRSCHGLSKNTLKLYYEKPRHFVIFFSLLL